jgi:hypothetical protein
LPVSNIQKKIIGQYSYIALIIIINSVIQRKYFQNYSKRKFGKEIKKHSKRWFFYWEKTTNCSFWIPKEKFINIAISAENKNSSRKFKIML